MVAGDDLRVGRQGAAERGFGGRPVEVEPVAAEAQTGMRLPAAALCRLARERGAYVHVDGAQTWGAFVMDLRAMDCDSYSASAHKWLCGPLEAGILYLRAERIAGIWPGVVGVGWGRNVQTNAAGARKFETLGQRNDATIAALGAALESGPSADDAI